MSNTKVRTFYTEEYKIIKDKSKLIIMRSIKFITGLVLQVHLNQWRLQKILDQMMDNIKITFCLKS